MPLLPPGPDRPAEPIAGYEDLRLRAALLAILLATFMSAFAVSSVNMVLPLLSRHLDTSYSASQWVVIGYLLAVSSSLVIAGRLSDSFGKRELFLAGASLFTLASALAAYTDSILALTLLRVAQGMGSGVLLAVNLAIVRQLSSPGSLPLNVGLVGSMSSLGTASGPVGGGALAEAWGWQAIFLANVPIGLAALILGWTFLPATRRKAMNRYRFDFAGSFLVVVSISSLVLAMRPVGGGDGHRVIFAILSLIAMAGFYVSALNTDRPVIDIADLIRSPFRVDLMANFLVSCVIMASLVIGPYYLTGGLALTLSQAGLVMAASPVVAAITSTIASRAVTLWGAELTGIVGLGIQAAGCTGMALLPLSWGVQGYLACLLVTTFGYATFSSSNNSGVMQKARCEKTGEVAGLLYLSRNIGLLFGATLMSTVFAWAARTAIYEQIPPDLNARGLNVSYGVAVILVVLALIARLRRWRSDLAHPDPAGTLGQDHRNRQKET